MMTIAINHQVDNGFDPVKSYSYHHFIIIQCLMDTMLHLDEAGNISSDLIKKWDISEDRKVYTFEIDPKYKFHTGDPITAKDIAFSLSRHLWKNNNSIVKYYLKSIKGHGILERGEFLKGIEIISDFKIRIHLNHPEPSLLYILTMPSFSIISREGMKNDRLISSGRMKLKRNKGGFTLHKWEKYIGEKPTLDKIRVITYKNPKDIFNRIEKEEIDLAIGLPIEIIRSFKNKNIVKDHFKSLSYNHLFFNFNKKIIQNDLFRKDFKTIMQRFAKEASKNSKFFSYQPYYFPLGIMPPNYYQNKSEENISIQDFSKKWRKSLKEDPLEIVLYKDAYPKDFLNRIENVFLKNKLSIKISRVKEDYVQRIKNKKYDIITGLYMGNYPDPDGFIQPLIPNQTYSFGVIPIKNDLKEIIHINNIKDKYERLNEYSTLFKKIEDKNYFIPMFKDKIPFVHNKKLHIINSEYRYESELWKIFWQD